MCIFNESHSNGTSFHCARRRSVLYIMESTNYQLAAKTINVVVAVEVDGFCSELITGHSGLFWKEQMALHCN